MTQYQAKLTLKPDTTPVFKKPRPVPFTLRDTLSQELDRLESDGIVEKVDHSDWASPIVQVPKGVGKIRICGDYKVTVNSHLEVDLYPLPKPDELFTALVGGKHFTKLDLKHVYQQMLLDEESRKLHVTINTRAPLHPWLWPSQPWQRIHIDFAGPIQGKMMLVVVDAHSKWPELATMTSTTAPATIRVLREMFATYGLPQQLVSDNGPQFTSTEFADFLEQNGSSISRVLLITHPPMVQLRDSYPL